MSARYWDLGGAERADLADVWVELLAKLRTDCASKLEEHFEELEGVNWGKKKRAEISDGVADVVISWMKSGTDWAGDGPPALADFVDGLGNLGWEILDPRRAAYVRDLLTEFNAAVERALTKAKESARSSKPRRPRIKRLKEE